MSNRRRALILGCGGVGSLVADDLAQQQWAVTGVRRSVVGGQRSHWRSLAADARDPQLYGHLLRRDEAPEALICALPPGLRRGGDGRIDEIIRTASLAFPSASLVLISTSGVYADSGGRRVAESGALGTSHRARRLVAIERSALTHPGPVWVLRATAITSAARALRSPRTIARRATVQAPLQRAFTWVHEADLAAVVVAAVGGRLPAGTWNVAAPGHITLISYWRQVAALAGYPIALVPSAVHVPERVLDAARLQQSFPHRWRSALAER